MAKSRELAQFANVSLTKSFAAWHALTKALFDGYRPEEHYMRGAKMAREVWGRD
jgi:hypothetical protein